MTRAEKIIEFIEKYIVVPEGKLIGKPIRLEEFQKKFIYAVYDNPCKTRRGILSTARKNGKTALIAALTLAHIAGPEAITNSKIVSGARSREQAALVFELAKKMVMFSPKLREKIKVFPSGKKLFGLSRNVEYSALSAEGKTAHGLSPPFAILDEVGQVRGSHDDFIEAIETSQGAYDNPLIIIISTQAASDSDLLSIWIDDALTSGDKKIVCHLHAAPKEADLLDESAWLAANPALDSFRDLNDLKEQLTQAKRMPSAENTARNLLLNQRVSFYNPFISKQAWQDCAVDELPDIKSCTRIYGGLDLSSRNDLTAFVLLGEHEGLWYLYPQMWTPEIGLFDRAKRDRAPYDLWVRQEHLRTTPTATIEYEWLAHDIAKITEGLSINAIAFDRWRVDILRKEFDKLGLDLPLVEFGQGFKDMSPAVDSLESLILNKRLRHAKNPVMNMCAANAVLIKNPAGDRKLEKIKTSGRIDSMVALLMAAGIAEREINDYAGFDDFIKSPLVL